MISIRNYLYVVTLSVAVVLLPQPVCGYLNIFINQQEMMKLMGECDSFLTICQNVIAQEEVWLGNENNEDGTWLVGCWNKILTADPVR